MNQKWFTYPLITVAIATVNFFPDLRTTGSRKVEIINQERVAQLFDISSEQLQRFLSDLQDKNSFIVQKMIQKIVQKTNKRANKSWTPLMYIAKGKILCEECTKKFELTCQHEEYKKLLHEVYEKVARSLIKDGADINVKNSNNKSALLIAFNSKNRLIIELLLSQPNVDLDIQDKRGLTPLHHAIELGDNYDTIACQLIKKGALLDIITKERKETPLMFAARCDCLFLTNALLAAGANPLLQDDVGRTAAELTTDSAVKHAIVTAKLKKRGESAIEKRSLEPLQAAMKFTREREKKERERQKLQDVEENELRQKALQAAEESTRKKEEGENIRIKERQKLKDAEENELRQKALQAAKESARKYEEKERERQKLQDAEEKELRQKALQAAKESARKYEEKERENARIIREEEKEKAQREKKQAKQQKRRLAKEAQKREKTIENKTTIMQSLARKIKNYIGKVFSRIKGIKGIFLSSFGRLKNWLW